MPIKIMFFAFNPEAIFRIRQPFLEGAGICVTGYVSCVDKYQEIYRQLSPDIICYHDGTINIVRYEHEFSCKLLAITEYFTREDQRYTIELARTKIQHGLHITGYVQNENQQLCAAIHLVNTGHDCFFPEGVTPH